jgi:putative hemolysin
MILGLLLIVIGLALSAFFSGTETGFYRVTRVRLVLASKAGSRIARGLLWLTNHPAVFVSTGLIGNNIANYSISLGIVLLLSVAFKNPSQTLEIILPVLSTPIVFVYGELLPKYLFFQNPNRLLSIAGPLYLVFVVLLAPISIVLYGFSWVMQRWMGQMPLKVRPELARKELQQVLQEGADAGLLLNVQRDMSKNVFDYGGQTVSQYCMPLKGLRSVATNTDQADLRRLLERTSQHIIAVLHPRTERLVGYFRVVDAILNPASTPKLYPVITLQASDSQIHAMTEMVSKNCELARVVDGEGKLIGVVLRQRLIGQIMQSA